jgi:hypothetical protein
MSRANGDRSGGCPYRHEEPIGQMRVVYFVPCHFVVPKALQCLSVAEKSLPKAIVE